MENKAGKRRCRGKSKKSVNEMSEGRHRVVLRQWWRQQFGRCPHLNQMSVSRYKRNPGL
jgi:hypothetical protein